MVRLVLGALIALAAILLLLQTGPGATLAGRIALTLANPWSPGSATLESAGGSWLTSLELRNVRIEDSARNLLITIDTLHASYSLRGLLSGSLKFGEVELRRPVVRTGSTETGSWALIEPFQRSKGPGTPADTTGSPLLIECDRLTLTDGAFAVVTDDGVPRAPFDFREISLRAHAIRIAGSVSITLDSLGASMPADSLRPGRAALLAAGAMTESLITLTDFSFLSPGSRVSASGRIGLTTLDSGGIPPGEVTVEATPVAYSDIARFVPGFGPGGSATVRFSARSWNRETRAAADLAFPGGGSLRIQGTARSLDSGTTSVELSGTSQDLSVAGLAGETDSTERMTARFAVRGTGLSLESFTGDVSVDVVESSIGGIGPFNVKLRSSAANGVLRPVLDATARNLALSLSGTIQPFAEIPTYSGTGTVRLREPAADTTANPLRRLAGLAATYRFRGSGFNPSTATVDFALDGLWEGHPEARSVSLSASLRDSAASVRGRLLTRTGSLSVNARMALAPALSYRVNDLEFENFNAALLFGESVQSNLTGTLALSGEGTDLPGLRASASGRIHGSSFGSIRIPEALFHAAAAGGRLMLGGSLESSAGSAEAESIAVGYAGTLFAEIPRLSLRSIDVGAFSEGAGTQSNFNGTLSLAARATSLDDIQNILQGNPPERAGALKADAHLTLGESMLKSQSITSASMRATLTDRDLDLTADLRTPEGGAKLEALARAYADSVSLRIPSATFRGINVGAMAGSTSFRTDLSGSLSLAAASRPGGTLNGSVALDLDDSRINREGVRHAGLRGILDRNHLSFNAEADLEHGRVDARASLTREGDLYSGDLSADVRLEDAGRLWSIDTTAPSSLLLALRSEGSLGPPERTRFLGVVTGKGSLDTLRADSIQCGFLVTGRTLSVDTLAVRSNAGTLTGHGVLALLDSTQTSDFHCSAELSSLDFLKYLTPVRRTSLRSARISCAVTGRSPNTRLKANADVRSAAIDDLFVGNMQLSGEAEAGSNAALRELTLLASASGISYGEATIQDATIAAHSAGPRHALNAYFQFDESHFIRTAGSMLTQNDSSVIEIDTLSLDGVQGLWNLESPAHLTLGETFTVRGLNLRNGSRTIAAEGVLDPDGTQNFSLRIDSVSLSQIGQVVGRRDLGGIFSLSLQITGPSEAATAVGNLRADLRGGASGVVSVAGNLDWRDSTLAARALVVGKGDSPLEFRAKLSTPLSIAPLFGRVSGDSTSMLSTLDSLLFRADRFDISTLHPFLNQKSIRQLRGSLTADIVGARVGQSLPLAGTVRIDSGLVDLPGLGVTYRDIALSAELADDSVRIDHLHVASGDGTADGEGVLHRGTTQGRTGSLHLMLDRFLAVQSLNVKATLSGDVLLSGTRKAPTLTGSLRLDDSYYYVESGSGGTSAEQVQLTDADYATLREKFGYVTLNRDVDAPAALPEISADLQIILERNNWIRKRANPTLAVELGGQLAIALRPQLPIRIVGTLRPVAGRSFVGQFGRQFEVTGGEIILNGAFEEIELGVDSEYRVKSTSGSGLTEVTILMRVEGKMGRYAFRLTSDPPMSEPEILQYLATGRASTGALAHTGDNYNLGSAVALEQVVGMAGSLTEGKLPLDVFQIRQDGARGVIIVAGSYVSPKTYLGVRQPVILDASSQSTYYKEQTQFEFEYEALPWLFLNFQGGSSRLLLLMKGRYAY